MMRKRVLIDANIIVRLFEGPTAKHYNEVISIFKDIESGRREGVLLDLIVAEVVYVTKRVYKREKDEIVDVLKKLISIPFLHVENESVLFRALEMYATANIDFADAVLCAKKELEGYGIFSFDKRVKRC